MNFDKLRYQCWGAGLIIDFSAGTWYFSELSNAITIFARIEAMRLCRIHHQVFLQAMGEVLELIEG
jgi:hypothetical protein